MAFLSDKVAQLLTKFSQCARSSWADDIYVTANAVRNRRINRGPIIVCGAMSLQLINNKKVAKQKVRYPQQSKHKNCNNQKNSISTGMMGSKVPEKERKKMKGLTKI